MAKSVTVRTPCSTANLGPGFDVFGLALDALYDEITLTKKGDKITIISSDDIPLVPKKNTAGLVVAAIKRKTSSIYKLFTIAQTFTSTLI